MAGREGLSSDMIPILLLLHSQDVVVVWSDPIPIVMSSTQGKYIINFLIAYSVIQVKFIGTVVCKQQIILKQEFFSNTD